MPHRTLLTTKGVVMLDKLRRIGYVAGVSVALVLLAAGCERATGGGFIRSDTGEGKATFGFNARCETTTLEDGREAAVTDGQLQYHDHAANVKFHAELEAFAIISPSPPDRCEAFDPGATTDQFFGGYRAEGGPEEAEGLVILTVRDNGEPGINGDEVRVDLIGGRYSGYSNSGTIEGGNIQVR